MSAQQVVVGHHASPDSYIRHGWKLCAVPAGTKGPTRSGWNDIDNALKVGDSKSNDGGIGLLHAYSGTMALDIDDLDEAIMWLAERGIDLQQLLAASDAVGVDSGNAGHAKLLFALPFPLASKKIIIGNKVVLELRCASANGKSVQDVLPPSRHPSGTTYRWVGRGQWQQLPTVPDTLMAVWMELLEADTRRNVPAGEGVPLASIEEVRKAVFAIDPNCSRKTWVEVGMGLAEQSPELFDLWDEWSQGSDTKYPGKREMVAQWKSFKEVQNGITVASVFHHAIAAGYQRPMPEMKFESILPPNNLGEVVKSITMTSPVPECDMTLWPAVLSRRALEVGAEVGCDPVVPLIAGLAAVSAVADKRMRLSINPTWHVPPNIWLMTIGEPADKKTPGSKPMFAPLRKLESEDQNRFQAEMLKWKGIEARHAGDMKAFREWQQSPDSHLPNAIPPAVTPLPPMPADLRLTISDATSQKVVTMAEQRPRGFLLYLDEMNRWLTKLSDARNTDDRGSWIQGYETGPYTMDRVGAGTIKVENLALSFYGNCQPEVFRRTVEGASSDGIIQRFLPVVLNPKHNAMWQKAVPEFMSSANDYEQLIRRTFALPTFDYEMGDEGTLVFRKFCEDALYTRETERLFNRSATFQTSLGKMEGSCARLILLFHLCENPYSYEVDADTVRRATTVFEKFFVPSMRFTYLEVAEQEEKLADDLLNLVVQWASVRETASLAEIRKGLRDNGRSKYGPSIIDQMIRIYMDDFSTLGYVAILQDHPRFPVWSINPAVADLFKNERQEIIRRKKERLDALKQNLADAGKPMSVPKFVIGE